MIRKRHDFGMAVERRIANQANRSRSVLSAPPDRPGSHTKADMASLDNAIGVRCHSAICLRCLKQTGWSNKQGGTTCFDDFVWRSNCAGVPPLLKVILPGWRWWRRRLEWGRYFQCNGWRGAPIFPSRSSRFSSGCKPVGWCLVGLIAICHVYSGQGMPRRIGSHQEMSHLTHSNAITISAPLRTVTPKGPKTSTNKSTTARSISERGPFGCKGHGPWHSLAVLPNNNSIYARR